MTTGPGYERSRSWFERACASLAGGVTSAFRRGGWPHPLFFRDGAGASLTDVDGNTYLDFTLAQGPAILGHAHPEVTEAVREALARPVAFAAQHEDEVLLAETLQRLIPSAERVRFSLTGSEAVHTALRLARACTGRPRFVRFEGHYHGWLDNVAFGLAPSEPGQPPRAWTEGLPERVFDEALVLPWNDADAVAAALERDGPSVAAVITEPVMCNSGCISPRPGFLAELRALCDRHGALLVFDEVITGFRLDPGGAQQRFGVTPDLAVFGKALGNGFPISALVGRAALMERIADNRVVHAGTLNGFGPSVAAARATLAVLEREGVCAHVARLGGRLRDGLQEAGERSRLAVRIQGPGPMLHMGFPRVGPARPAFQARDLAGDDPLLLSRVVQGLQARGVRVIGRGLWYVGAAHREAHIDHAVAAFAQVLKELGSEADR